MSQTNLPQIFNLSKHKILVFKDDCAYLKQNNNKLVMQHQMGLLGKVFALLVTTSKKSASMSLGKFTKRFLKI